MGEGLFFIIKQNPPPGRVLKNHVNKQSEKYTETIQCRQKQCKIYRQAVKRCTTENEALIFSF